MKIKGNERSAQERKEMEVEHQGLPKKQKSLKLNFIMNAFLTMSNFIFPLITFPYVSRVLLPLGTGKVAFATSIVTYFSMFAQLGIPTYGIRACAQVRDKKEELSRVTQELLLVNLAMTVISYAAFAMMLITIPKIRAEKTLFLVMSSMILLNSLGMEWLYKALEEYTYITIRSVFFKILSIGAMFLLVKTPEHYVRYGAISILASSASNLFNFIYAHKFISLRPVYAYNFKRHIQPVLIFFAMSCATTIYTNLDTVMLGMMKSEEDVGFYNAAVKIKNVLVSVITSLGTVILPRVSYYVEHQMQEEFLRTAKKAVWFVWVCALPLMVYFIMFAREGIYFLSGTAYQNSVFPMQLLMPTLLFIGLTNIMGIQIMVPLGKENLVLRSVCLGALVDLLINAWLIPKYASIGAAIGTLAAEFVVLCYQYWEIKRMKLVIFERLNYKVYVAALVLAVLAVLWVKHWSGGVFATLCISSVLFFSVYAFILLLAKEPLLYELYRKYCHR